MVLKVGFLNQSIDITWEFLGNENFTELEALGVAPRIPCYKLSWYFFSTLKFENHFLWQHN